MALKSQVKFLKKIYKLKTNLHQAKCLYGQVQSGYKIMPQDKKNTLVFLLVLMENVYYSFKNGR